MDIITSETSETNYVVPSLDCNAAHLAVSAPELFIGHSPWVSLLGVNFFGGIGTLPTRAMLVSGSN